MGLRLREARCENAIYGVVVCAAVDGFIQDVFTKLEKDFAYKGHFSGAVGFSYGHFRYQ
jgi:hypothetical protein